VDGMSIFARWFISNNTGVHSVYAAHNRYMCSPHMPKSRSNRALIHPLSTGVMMKPEELQQLKKVVIERARVIPRLTPEQIQLERKRSRRLARFLSTRLVQLGITSEELASRLDIEPELVQVLLDGTFPVSELNVDFLIELAAQLKCPVKELRRVMLEDERIKSPSEDCTASSKAPSRPKTQRKSENRPRTPDMIPNAHPNHDLEQAIDRDD